MTSLSAATVRSSSAANLPDVAAQLLRQSLQVARATAVVGTAFGLLLLLTHVRGGSAAQPQAWLWWGLLAAAMLARGVFCQRLAGRRSALSRRSADRFSAFATLEGALWATGLLGLLPPQGAGALIQLGVSEGVLLVFLVAYGMTGRAFLLAAIPLALAQLIFVFVRDVPLPDVMVLGLAATHATALYAAWHLRRSMSERLVQQRAAESSARAQDHAAAELHRGREQLRLALDAIDAGVADTNLISGERFFSARYAELLGYRDRGRFLAGHRFSDALHPEDRARVLAARAAHIDAGAPFRQRCRMRMADGNYLWVQVRGESVRGSDGRATRLVVSVVDISAQREAELRIAESERRYRALVEASPSLIWTCDADGYVTFVSDRACRTLYGLEPGEVLGRHVAEFNAPEFRRFTFLRRFAPALRGQPVYDVAAVHRASGGATAHVTVSVLPTLGPDGRIVAMLGVCSDITALKRREAELDLALRNQQAIFDAAGEGIVFVRSGRIETANRAMAKMLGVTRGYLIGQPAAELLAQVSEWNLIQRAARDAALRGEAAIHELLLRARDGRSVWCQLTAREIDAATMIMVLTDITVLKRREELAWHQANHDELTGLPNRRSLIDHARRLLSVVIRQRRMAAVLVLDLDGFKEVNDIFGHAFGDALLRRVALRLSGVLREYDVLARTGGDEFVILLPEIDNLAGARAVAQKLVAAAGEDLESAGRVLPIRVSIGVALFPDDGEDFETLLAQADAAMYAAKAGGKNQFSLARDLPAEARPASA